MLHFMMGWIIAVGFSYLRFLTAVSSIIAFHFFSDMIRLVTGAYSFWGSLVNSLIHGASLRYALSSALMRGSGAGEVFALRLPAPAISGCLVLLAVLMAAIIEKATEKLPIKS
jgi:hypothetical protein